MTTATTPPAIHAIKPEDDRYRNGLRVKRVITNDNRAYWSSLTILTADACGEAESTQVRLIAIVDYDMGLVKMSRFNNRPLSGAVYFQIAATVRCEKYETTHDGRGTGRHEYTNYLIVGSEEQFFRAIREDGLMVDAMDGKGYGYTIEDAARGIIDYEEDLLHSF